MPHYNTSMWSVTWCNIARQGNCMITQCQFSSSAASESSGSITWTSNFIYSLLWLIPACSLHMSLHLSLSAKQVWSGSLQVHTHVGHQLQDSFWCWWSLYPNYGETGIIICGPSMSLSIWHSQLTPKTLSPNHSLIVWAEDVHVGTDFASRLDSTSPSLASKIW